MNEKRTVWIAYPEAITFSGQTAVSKKIFSKLSRETWNVNALPYPPFDRSKNNYFSYFLGLLKIWYQTLMLIFKKNPIIYFTHGQSIFSFVRMGIPHLLVSKLNASSKIIVALHGNVFTTWDQSDRKLKFLTWLIDRSNLVTVSGLKQKKKLIESGIEESKIQVLQNMVEFEIINQNDCVKLHSTPNNSPLKILFLSLLIESKGYPEYLEALELLSKTNLVHPIEATLCGTTAFTSFCKRFTTPEVKEQWIEEKIQLINQSEKVKVRWIKGAYGKDFENLFKSAHVFILPSSFPVESQPLTILDALGSGTAIITSKAGEIESTVSNDSAYCLTNPSAEQIAKHIEILFDDDTRLNMSIAGIERAEAMYSETSYIKTWDSFFKRIS